jgi:hypothetical protein
VSRSNIIYLVVGAVKRGLNIEVGPNGLSIDKK